ncbi:hypothetical protein C0989_010909, partial [Termitomyces sp. Mn162]
MKAYGPNDICRFLEVEQTLIDANKSNPAAADTSPTAFMAKTSRYEKLVCSGCKSRNRSNFLGYTVPWCILEGSGMARKTVEELRTAWIVHYNAQRKAKGRGKAASRVTITLAGGSAFTVEGDSDVIAAYIAMHKGSATPKAEFAGLASN